MKSSSGEKHFTSLDFGDKSVFSSPFPVDSSAEEVREITRVSIPAALDDVFLIQPSTQTYTTDHVEGAIAIVPLSAKIDLSRIQDPDIKRGVDAREFVFDSLTDRQPLTTIHTQIDIESSLVSSFSIFARNSSSPGVPFYELRGHMGDEETTDTFEVAKHGKGGPEWSLAVDEKIATEFLNALEERRTCRYSDGSLQQKLTELAQASKSSIHEQSGSYYLDRENLIHVSVERTKKIRKGIATVATWSIVLNEQISNNSYNSSRTFTLDYDRIRSQRYKARLDQLVEDIGCTTSHSKRESDFQSLSEMFRDHPEMLFAALSEAIKKLQIIELD